MTRILASHCLLYKAFLAYTPSSPKQNNILRLRYNQITLTLILQTWKIRWAPNNASKWQMGFTLAFKGLNWLRKQKTPPETSCMIGIRQAMGTVLTKNHLFGNFIETYFTRISYISINLPEFRDIWLVTIRPRAHKSLYLRFYVLTRDTELIYTQNLQELWLLKSLRISLSLECVVIEMWRRTTQSRGQHRCFISVDIGD
jgi:hypothetical protein